jgi:large subunit ribosomal protein L12
MEYVYAAMLLHSAGKKVDEAGINKILKASGVEVNEARSKALVAALEDINIDDAIKTAAVAPAAAGPSTAPAAEGAPKEEASPAEEEEEEPSEEEALAGLGSLFG